MDIKPVDKTSPKLYQAAREQDKPVYGVRDAARRTSPAMWCSACPNRMIPKPSRRQVGRPQPQWEG